LADSTWEQTLGGAYGESQVDSQLPLSGEPLLNQSTILEEASIASSQLATREVAPSLPSDDGITVSMFNGKSRLKIFGSLSALSVFSTDRPFAPGMPLFLLPESPFGLDTNTFDIHGRQSNIGATFIGPEANGFTPSATFVLFIANNTQHPRALLRGIDRFAFFDGLEHF